jgi:hypothetical protein
VTDETIDLDGRRGMAAQKATALRRLLADVEANEKELRLRQDELETHLIAAPAANWDEVADKACYLLKLFAATLEAQDPRRQTLIASVLADFKRLSSESHALKRRDPDPAALENEMAKGQQRSNREKKKPKADKNKKKSAPAVSPFTPVRMTGKDGDGRK